MGQLSPWNYQRGDVVLDPFMGSGSTALVCLGMDRRYVGIERMDEYVKGAEETINKLKSSKPDYAKVPDKEFTPLSPKAIQKRIGQAAAA